LVALAETKPPHPEIKYWIITLRTLEVIQKRARPLGTDKVIMANIIGIIHSIIWFCDCCLGSAVEVITIFCCTHMAPPTKTANKKVWSGTAKFSQRNLLPTGNVEYTIGQG